jgi:hypothetical protein
MLSLKRSVDPILRLWKEVPQIDPFHYLSETVTVTPPAKLLVIIRMI